MGSSHSTAEGGLTSNGSLVQNNSTDPSTIAIISSSTPKDVTTSQGTNEFTSNPSTLNDLSTPSPFTNSTYDGLNNSTITPQNGTLAENDFKILLFGTSYYPFKWLTLENVASWLGPLSSVAMVLGCVMPYVPQYATIHKNKNCSGFSTYVCLTLLLANILRIAFWFGHPFELPLFIQSILMIITQILLLELCVRVKKESRSVVLKTFFSFKPQYFWRWTDLASYLEFLFLFSLLLGVATYFLLDCELYIESLGYCALVIESMLGLPQVIRNCRKKSVVGMSLSMVLMWLAGDTFKTAYYIKYAVPYQFWLCGMLQILIDLFILFQVCLFRQSAPTKMMEL